VSYLHAVVILAAVALGAVSIGSWAWSSPLLGRWVAQACQLGPELRPELMPGPPAEPGAAGRRFSRRAWAASTAVAAGLATGVTFVRRGAQVQPVELALLAEWSCMLCVLGLIDAQHRVVPTPVVRAGAVATAGLVVATSLVTTDWRYVVQGVAVAVAAVAIFGAWSLLSPDGLGFGDVRMAGLVALGGGALAPGATVVALSCAPLAAGLSGRCLRRRLGGLSGVVCWGAAGAGDTIAGSGAAGSGAAGSGAAGSGAAGSGAAGSGAGRTGLGAVAVPLGPFLAFAGIVAVVANAL